MQHAYDVSSLREQGVQRYANTYVDRQVGQPIVALGSNNLIGQTFYGHTPSTVEISAYKTS